MKRTALCLCLLLQLCLFAAPARAGEVRIGIIGDDDLTSLAPGIRQTVTARCIASGVNLDECPDLSINVLQMGDALSFDAILEATPPTAFHTDLTDRSDITKAIDDMLTSLLSGTPAARLHPEASPDARPAPRRTPDDIKLPFVATSLIVHDGSVYVSDKKTIYILKDKKPEPWWSAPGKDTVFRIYSYKGSIVVLARRGDIFNSYRLEKGSVLQHWNSAVIPIGNALVSSQITSDIDVPDGIGRWNAPVTVDGDPLVLPEGIDLPTAAIADVMPSRQGPEIIAYDRTIQLTIRTVDKLIWSFETGMNTLPLFLEQDIHVDDPPARYYMRPRILVRGGEIITIQNDRGMSKIFGNIIIYNGSDILAFSSDRDDFADRIVAHIGKYYCADIALRDTTLIALVIREKQSSVRFIDL